MRLARQVGEDENPCYSRQIGTVIVDPVANKILGTGYNGPPKDVPHCDTRDYLSNCFYPQLNEKDKRIALSSLGFHGDLPAEPYAKEEFLNRAVNCRQCPRKLIMAESGKRSELCACQHSERNAITNSGCSLIGAYAFCWCTLPCQDCTGALINARISKVFCLNGKDYSYSSRYLFGSAGVEIHQYDSHFFDS